MKEEWKQDRLVQRAIPDQTTSACMHQIPPMICKGPADQLHPFGLLPRTVRRSASCRLQVFDDKLEAVRYVARVPSPIVTSYMPIMAWTRYLTTAQHLSLVKPKLPVCSPSTTRLAPLMSMTSGLWSRRPLAFTRCHGSCRLLALCYLSLHEWTVLAPLVGAHSSCSFTAT